MFAFLTNFMHLREKKAREDEGTDSVVTNTIPAYPGLNPRLGEHPWGKTCTRKVSTH